MAKEFYVTIEGTKQGMFRGEYKNRIMGLAFGYEVISPRDATLGQATGKRRHQPIWFVKEWSPVSPQIFQALVTNEVLKSVLFEFYQKTPAGIDELYFTINITNASFSGMRFLKGNDGVGSTCLVPGASLAGNSKELEVVTLTFQRIEIESKTGKTIAVDEWI